MRESTLTKLEFPKILEKIAFYAVSSPGKEFIYNLKPMKNKTEMERALSETEEALRLLDTEGTPPFSGIFDVRSQISYIGKGGTAGAEALLHIANVMKTARLFIPYIGKGDNYYHLHELAVGLTPLKSLENAIYDAIISENEIADQASKTLFNIRRTLRDKTSSVKDKIQGLVRSNEKYLQDQIYTVRGDRYVLPVRSEHKSQVKGLVHDQSASGATLFIEPISLVNLNNEIKELLLKEKAEIERILQELSRKVEMDISKVEHNAHLIYELDAIFSKAKYASRIDATRPRVEENLTFDLKDARHPLIPEKEVISSTIYMEEHINSLIITGPNTGGKTVTLKTVGLLHLMAMAGILIPVREGSSVGNFKEIFADIGDEQSIEQSLSTFSSHMTNIVKIIEESDKDSLALFDELGAGTDPTEGAALAMAILETLKSKQVKIMATTHYSELKAYALKAEGTLNASVEFDVESLKPTYRLLIGVAGKSNAFLISKRLGLQDDIITLARSLIDQEARQFEDLLESLETSKREASKDARTAENLKREIIKKEEELREKLKNIDNIRQKAMDDAKREARQYLKEAKEKSDEILKELRKLESHGGLKDSRRSLQEIRDNLKSEMEKGEQQDVFEKVEGKQVKDFKEGEEVLLSTLNQKVTILSLPDSKGDLRVQAGIMKLNVNKKDLVELEENKSQTKIAKREARLNLKPVSLQVDVRGQDGMTAEQNVDYYLDEASLGGLEEVTVIHGMGTGVLKDTLWEMFRHHPHVKKYRLGEYGEGGNGVTIVTLK